MKHLSFSVTLSFEATVKMPALSPDFQEAFVAHCLASQPDLALTDDRRLAENTAWWRDLWQHQCRFQQELLASSDDLAAFLRHLVLCHLGLDGHEDIQTSLEDAARAPAERTGAVEFFFPEDPMALGIWLGDTVSEIVDGSTIKLSAQPTITVRPDDPDAIISP